MSCNLKAFEVILLKILIKTVHIYCFLILQNEFTDCLVYSFMLCTMYIMHVFCICILPSEITSVVLTRWPFCCVVLAIKQMVTWKHRDYLTLMPPEILWLCTHFFFAIANRATSLPISGFIWTNSIVSGQIQVLNLMSLRKRFQLLVIFAILRTFGFHKERE